MAWDWTFTVGNLLSLIAIIGLAIGVINRINVSTRVNAAELHNMTRRLEVLENWTKNFTDAMIEIAKTGTMVEDLGRRMERIERRQNGVPR